LPNPGAKADSSRQLVLPLTEGYAGVALVVSRNAYVSVVAPSLPAGFEGIWAYEIAASIDAPFAGYTAELVGSVLDTDSGAALLVSNPLSSVSLSDPDEAARAHQQWMSAAPPFKVFAYARNDTRYNGVRRSYCGMSMLGPQPGLELQSTMIDRFPDGFPRAQYYMRGLDPGELYNVVLALDGNSTASGSNVIGGGGRVWAPLKLVTKSGKILRF